MGHPTCTKGLPLAGGRARAGRARAAHVDRPKHSVAVGRKNIPLRSTLRVVWVRPSSEEGEWEIFHPFSKAPLSVYEDMLHAAEVAVELVGLEGGGSVGLLDADGESLNEVAVPPADDEGTSQPPATP